MPDKPLNASDVELLSKKTIYNGFMSVVDYRLRHRTFGGGWTDNMERILAERKHAAAVLPYDPKRDEVVLVEQFRIGALASSHTPWLFECVAGIIEGDESAESVAKREAVEEAACDIDNLIAISNYLTSPGGSNERIWLYCGITDSSQIKHGQICGLKHENEDIRVHVVKRQTALDWVKTGKIDNASSIIALQWLELNYETL